MKKVARWHQKMELEVMGEDKMSSVNNAHLCSPQYMPYIITSLTFLSLMAKGLRAKIN